MNDRGRADNPSGSGVREYYEETYHFDEDVERPNFRRLWRALRLLEPLSGTTFLDLGSGVGWATNLALTRGGVTLGVGLDFSARALRSAKRFTPRGCWVHADGTRLPFADSSFDRAFSFGSVEHFPDIRAGFAELYRVLKPAGLAVVVVPNFWVRTDQPLEFRATRGGWTRVMTDSGFRVVRVGTDWGPSIFKNRRPLRILLRLLVRVVSVLPPLRYQFIFVLSKVDAGSVGARNPARA